MKLKEKEKKEAVAYMNSLKEELKVVFQHTQHLEKLLKNEKRSHRERYNELNTRDGYYFVNISQIEEDFERKLRETEVLFQLCRAENIDVKRRHIEVQQRFIRTNEDYNLYTGKSEEDMQSLKQSNEMAMLSLNDRVEDLLSQKKYYQKISLQYSEDYKKTMKKLTQCYNVLSLLNSTEHLNSKHGKKVRKVKRTIDKSSGKTKQGSVDGRYSVGVKENITPISRKTYNSR